MYYLSYLCLLAYSGVQTHIVLCFCFVFHRLVYPMFPVSLDSPFLIALSVFSNVYLRQNPWYNDKTTSESVMTSTKVL